MSGAFLKSLRVVMLVAMGLVVVTSNAQSGQFSAEMKELVGDSTVSYQFHCQDAKYRYAGAQYGEQFVLIVNEKTGKSIILNPALKQYMKMDISDVLSAIADPFQALNLWKDVADKQEAGAEDISGYSCTKTELLYGGEKTLTFWYSAELAMPLRIELHGPQPRAMELTGIKVEPVADNLFEIPEGYTRFVPPDEQPVEIPEWAGDIPAAPLMTPPFEHELANGAMLRIKVEPGKSIWIKGTSEAESTARALPFKNGSPLKKVTWYNNFAQKGTICSRSHESVVEADEVVVRVFDGGPVALTAKYSDMHEKAVKAGEEFRVPLGTDNITVRIVNLIDGESAFNWTYTEKGQELTEDQIGPAKYRAKSLDGMGDLYRMTWTASGDELVISVTQGQVQIKLGQFDSFTF